MLPSIWLDEFDSSTAWQSKQTAFSTLARLVDGIDDRMIRSMHPFTIEAWCAACESPQRMKVSWHFSGNNGQGSIHPAWTEIADCESCGLNSRMRALFSFVAENPALPTTAKIYVAERVTAGYRRLKKRFPSLIGSEYLGANAVAGRKQFAKKAFAKAGYNGSLLIQHEDLTQLSFPDASFDAVITQDVFEHVPDYESAFGECYRVLKHGASLIFTIPFFPNLEKTEIRATISADGTLHHLLPPEFHGNPVGEEGSLCFQHFGWDILDSLRKAGFAVAKAHLYWGPWQGHFGLPFFVFCAQKTID